MTTVVSQVDAGVTKVEQAEAALKAAMPHPFQLADPTKLLPAITEAKNVGVSQELIEAAEAKPREGRDEG